MRVRCGVGGFILFSLFSPLLGQSLVSSILNAHGGAASLAKAGKYQLTGTVTRDGQTVPFLLKVDGENSRFEKGTYVSIKRGMVGQWSNDGRRSDIRPLPHGDQDLYFVPFLALRELASKYQAAGRVEGQDAFVCRPRLQRFIGYEPDVPVIRGSFDPETHRLGQVAFLTEGGERQPMRYVYSDYAVFDGLAVARRVEYWMGNRLFETFAIESVDFNPVLSTNDFTIQPR